MTNAEQVAANIVAREHMPVAQDVGDGAGVTFPGGQTKDWLEQWGLQPPTDEAEAVTNLQSWFAQSGLQVVINYSVELGDALADFAYNSGGGLRTGVKAIQTAVGVVSDGIIGAATLSAISRQTPTRLSEIAKLVAKGRIHYVISQTRAGHIGLEFLDGLVARALTFL